MEPLRTLRQCLIDADLVRLRVIARLWGLDLQASHHLKVVAELAGYMTDPAHATHLWETLPAGERTALEALLEAEGHMPAGTFARRFGQIRPMGPGRLEREAPWRDPVGPAEGLWYRGLIHQGFAEREGKAYPVLYVPDELRAVLPGGVRDEPEAGIQLEPVETPSSFRHHGQRLLDDMTTLLAFVHNDKVRPLIAPIEAPDAWPDAARRRLARCLRDPDPERLAFLLHLLGSLGWSRVDEEGRLRLAAEPVSSWLKAPAAEQRTALVGAWQEMAGWNELWRLPDLRPDDTGTWHNDPTLARAALLRHLEALTPGVWVTVEDFVQAIKVVDPDFQRPGGDYEAWYIQDAASGEYLTGFESWDRVEGALLEALLTGPAWWLGLVELGSGDVFRPLLPEPRSLESPPRVRSDLTISMPAARRFDRFQLARVADLAAVGRPYVYFLSPSSLERARRQKITVEKILSFLESLSEAPLPKSVRSSLVRWTERGGEIWLERTVLLRVADEALLRRIVEAPQTSRYVGRVVGPTAAIVAEKDWPKLREALAEMELLTELVGLGPPRSDFLQ